MRRLAIFVVVTAVVSLAVPAGVDATNQSSRRAFEVTVLSGRPDQVSGGDALVEVRVPQTVSRHKVTVTLNGEDVTSAFEKRPNRTLVGLVDGLVDGENTLEVQGNGRGRGRPAPVELTLLNHPSSGPIFSGPQQQPFVCATARATFDGRKLLGQPLVDNQDPFGIPVAAEDAAGNYPQDGRGYPTADAQIVGWSKDCAATTRVGYVYRNTAGQFRWLDAPTQLPADIATTTTLDGATVPFVVRWERGTINRFIYSIAMLAPVGESDPAQPDDSLWNDRLVLSFQGGVAIGHHQGTTSTGSMLPADLLGQGYAVQWSSGNRTNTHYNLQLGGETALMVKERFVETHGVPWYTVSVGGSGGAIQQYVFAQNHPGLIDAAIPQYSYSDMITQTVHVGDCELLEHYFDVTDGANPRWLDPEVRQAVMGLNATNAPQNLSSGTLNQWNQLYALYAALGYPVMERAPGSAAPALTECRAGWFGLTPLTLNPTFTNVSDLDKLAQGTAGVEWTHAADLVNIYGTDETGFARRPWDNVGVQYGLQALLDGVITPEEFLDLNAEVGGWKQSAEIVEEGFPLAGPLTPENFDPWSSRNMNLSPNGTTPAPRTEGDLQAMQAAYTSGMVFDGDIDIPVIDWRHYLENELDMHHTQQSFATRQRMRDADGDAGNQVIWFTDARPARAFDQTAMAFAVIDEWMANIRDHPNRGVAENRPEAAVDSCFDTSGNLIARGGNVWDGILNPAEPAGACTSTFPVHSTTRRVAGGPFRGGVFKCQLQPVAVAIDAGVYGSWAPDAAQQARLEEVFPGGVCDWSGPDAGRPSP